jgi:hypothetical protein
MSSGYQQALKCVPVNIVEPLFLSFIRRVDTFVDKKSESERTNTFAIRYSTVGQFAAHGLTHAK